MTECALTLVAGTGYFGNEASQGTVYSQVLSSLPVLLVLTTLTVRYCDRLPC